MLEFIATILGRLEKILDPQSSGKLVVGWLMNLAVALAVMAALYLLWQVRRVVLRFMLRLKTDATTFSFIETITKFSLLVIGVVTALDSAGIKTSALLASLGIAGLTIGFAALLRSDVPTRMINR